MTVVTITILGALMFVAGFCLGWSLADWTAADWQEVQDDD